MWKCKVNRVVYFNNQDMNIFANTIETNEKLVSRYPQFYVKMEDVKPIVLKMDELYLKMTGVKPVDVVTGNFNTQQVESYIANNTKEETIETDVAPMSDEEVDHLNNITTDAEPLIEDEETDVDVVESEIEPVKEETIKETKPKADKPKQKTDKKPTKKK